ncbi:MAG: PTPA-CTERM sorting domain-containing protein [Limnothrix sp.]
MPSKINKHQLAIVTTAFLSIGLTSPANALTFKTFTDKDTFQEAASGLSLETFNQTATSTAKNHDLSDFAIRSNMTWTKISDDIEANVDGSTFLQLQSRNHTTEATLTFDNQINAFGFDWVNTDNSANTLELIINDRSYSFGAPQQSGFFGIIADNLFSEVSFSDAATGGYLQHGGIDNIRYGLVEDVPTPAAILPTLLGISANLLRRKKQF